MATQDGFVLWFTGLSASGKTTLAQAVEKEMMARGMPRVQRLDGDVVREDLTRDLGFSKEDRDENIRRIAFVAQLLSSHGVATLCSFISPYREARAHARTRCRRFIEVFVDCPMDVLLERDPKGLYKKAMAGQIRGFTGVDDPYEAPESPEIVVHTARQTVEQSTQVILSYLETHGLLGAQQSGVMSSVRLVDRTVSDRRRLRQADGPVLVLSDVQVSELDAIGCGLYSPLTGFMTSAEYERVISSMRLPDGSVWTVPITLPVPNELRQGIRCGMVLTLCDEQGETHGLLEVKDIFSRDLKHEAQSVYGTTETIHPGVARLMEEPEAVVGGDIHLLQRSGPSQHPLNMDPEVTRELFSQRGWKTIVAFQTRNPIHRAHEYLLKCALEIFDGLFVNPLVGETQKEDLPVDLRMRCYEEVLQGYFPKERTILGTFPVPMRYAGPREAVHHALCRRNYGCTHMIVGRDHAGVGGYYGTYDAQRIFDRFTPEELGITPLCFEHAFYCRVCGQVASKKTCPHDAEHHLFLSGTKVREMLSGGTPLPDEFTRAEVAEILRGAL